MMSELNFDEDCVGGAVINAWLIQAKTTLTQWYEDDKTFIFVSISFDLVDPGLSTKSHTN